MCPNSPGENLTNFCLPQVGKLYKWLRRDKSHHMAKSYMRIQWVIGITYVITGDSKSVMSQLAPTWVIIHESSKLCGVCPIPNSWIYLSLLHSSSCQTLLSTPCTFGWSQGLKIHLFTSWVLRSLLLCSTLWILGGFFQNRLLQ